MILKPLEQMPFGPGERTHKLPSNFIYLKIWDPASARRRGLNLRRCGIFWPTLLPLIMQHTRGACRFYKLYNHACLNYAAALQM